jgi:hypothetical protein
MAELTFDEVTIRVSFWQDERGTAAHSIMRTDSGRGGMQWDVSADDLRALAAMLANQAYRLDEAHEPGTVNI